MGTSPSETSHSVDLGGRLLNPSSWNLVPDAHLSFFFFHFFGPIANFVAQLLQEELHEVHGHIVLVQGI